MSICKQGILLFSILIFSYAYIHQGLGWNQNSRLDLLHALVVHKTLKIDAYHGNTGDKSVHNGHYYSDKAPGIVFLALPAFSLSVVTLKLLEIPLDSPRGWLISSWICTVGSVGLITALGGVAIFAFLRRLVDQRLSFVTVLIVFLGSTPFPYATMLFSHAAVIGLLCIALWGIADEAFLRAITRGAGFRSFEREIEVNMEASTRVCHRHTLAGICCGFAISSEYTASVAAGGILALASSVSLKRAVVLGLASIPALLLIPSYNWLCFGSPFSFGYHYLALPEFQQMNEGLFGITLPPKPDAGYLILFSPARGLFFWTPFMLVAFVGANPLKKTSPILFWTSCVVIVLYIVLISGYYMPNGGSAIGARHLAPVIPFLTMAAAFGLKRIPYCGSLLGVYSILLTGLGTVVNAMPPTRIANPLLDFYLPRLTQASYAPNIGDRVGMPRHTSALLVGVLSASPLIITVVSLRKTCVNSQCRV